MAIGKDFDVDRGVRERAGCDATLRSTHTRGAGKMAVTVTKFTAQGMAMTTEQPFRIWFPKSVVLNVSDYKLQKVGRQESCERYQKATLTALATLSAGGNEGEVIVDVSGVVTFVSSDESVATVGEHRGEVVVQGESVGAAEVTIKLADEAVTSGAVQLEPPV